MTRRFSHAIWGLGGICVGVLIATLYRKANPHFHGDFLSGTSQAAADRREARVAGEVRSQSENGGHPRSLQELQGTLRDHSHQSIVALWQLAEDMQSTDLRRLFLDVVKDGQERWPNSEIAAVLLERLVRIDPQGATALIEQLDARGKANSLPILAATAPSAALSIYRRLDESQRSSVPAEGLLKALAVVDVTLAIEMVGMLEMQNRGRAYGVVASSLSTNDPASAIAFLKTLSDVELAGGLSDIDALGRIGSFDPSETAELVDRLPLNSRAAGTYARLAESWVAVDPEKARAWVNSIELEAIRTRSLESLYSAWAKADREKAFGALGEIQDEALRRRIFGDMAGEVIAQDPKGAAEWARSLEGEQRSFALGLVGSEVARRDPQLASQYLSEAIKGGEAPLVGVSEGIGYAYALKDPEAAGSWALGLPVGDLQQHAVEGIARALTSRDPVAASNWIGTLPEGDTRNGAIYYLVEGIQAADPESAFRWAGSIFDDPEKRLYLLQRSTDSWTRSSPEMARAAIEQLSIPSKEKLSLLRRLQY